MKAAFAAEMEVWRAGGRIRRLWAGDKSLWAGTDEDKWVGWLRVVEQELADLDRFDGFAQEVKQRGYTDVVLLGMGDRAWVPKSWARPSGANPAGRISTCWTAPIPLRSRRSNGG